MSLSRLNSQGTDLTVAKWNGNCDSLENIGIYFTGFAVLGTGLLLSAGTGLGLNISDGVFMGKTIVALSSIPTFQCPTNGTYYIWINEDGSVSTTTTTTNPGSRACLGRVVTDGTTITSVTTHNRDEVFLKQNQEAQGGGYITIALTGNLVLNISQYGNRVIEFTGTLGGQTTVEFPALKGGEEWTIINSTNQNLRPKVTGQMTAAASLVTGKTAKFCSNGTTLLRVTADCP